MQGRSIRRSGQPTRATASRMRGFDRDLIRGGHYGQRSCEPHSKAEHMAAPTKPCDVKILLANPEPSTHGTKRSVADRGSWSALGGRADMHIEPADFG